MRQTCPVKSENRPIGLVFQSAARMHPQYRVTKRGMSELGITCAMDGAFFLNTHRLCT